MSCNSQSAKCREDGCDELVNNRDGKCAEHRKSQCKYCLKTYKPNFQGEVVCGPCKYKTRRFSSVTAFMNVGR